MMLVAQGQAVGMHRPIRGDDALAREAELRQQFEQNRMHFVLVELDMAATFCDVAKSASDPEKVKRNVKNARTAYDTAIKFAREAHSDATSKTEFDAKLDNLKFMLVSLGERL